MPYLIASVVSFLLFALFGMTLGYVIAAYIGL